MIVSVAGGKSGTGKTLVATSLALSLAGTVDVCLLDCDVEAPDDNTFLRMAVTRREPVIMPVAAVDEAICNGCGLCVGLCAYNAITTVDKKAVISPALCHGCGCCSYYCPEEAIMEKEREIGIVASGGEAGMSFVQGELHAGKPGAASVVRRVRECGSRNGVVIIDAAPGMSCLVVKAIEGSDFCLLVTEPGPFGLDSLLTAVPVIRELGIPCGVVINRSNAGDGQVVACCAKEKIPVLLTIPLDIEIARTCSRGSPLVVGLPQWQPHFSRLFGRIKEVSVDGHR